MYRLEPSGGGTEVTIRNTGEAPGFAPRWLLRVAMRRALAAGRACSVCWSQGGDGA